MTSFAALFSRGSQAKLLDLLKCKCTLEKGGVIRADCVRIVEKREVPESPCPKNSRLLPCGFEIVEE